MFQLFIFLKICIDIIINICYYIIKINEEAVDMTVKTMFYGTYKNHFSDCKTIKGSYDVATKSIDVEIPDDRIESFESISLKKPAKKNSNEIDEEKAKKLDNVRIVNMRYGVYKERYADCKTVKGTYDERWKSIDVIVPNGRMKPSGVRGKHFHGYELWLEDENGKFGYCTYRAVSSENAMKQHIKWCKQQGWTPCDPPEGCIAHIYL